jgi:CDP-glucose 4,6-dehydratase
MSVITSNFWRQKRVLVTGHTGFKGSWLSLWLQNLGALTYGVSLDPPTTPSLFNEANVEEGMGNYICDIRNKEKLLNVFMEVKPDIVFHLAAQPLVRESYIHPIDTFETNILGTLNVLESARKTGTVRTILNVTTDKVYKNNEWLWAYRENEELGGHDPYSCSKSCAELVTETYRKSFLSKEGILIATARAGNVFGGGDWAVDRLVPDTITALHEKRPVILRNPNSTRPWQHVLEPLSGYLMLAERMYLDGPEWEGPWNFGPEEDDSLTVASICGELHDLWGCKDKFHYDYKQSVLHEAENLKLSITKAKNKLKWKPKYKIKEALQITVDWYTDWYGASTKDTLTINQIKKFMGNSEK